MRNSLLSIVLFGSALSGCASHSLPRYPLPEIRDLPFIHKIDIQQGNVLSQEMLGQLRRGMDKKKIQFIMGTPIIQDTFNASRWDYVYTLQHRGGTPESRHITLVFADEKLDRVEGNIKAAEGDIEVALHQDQTIDVPKQASQSLLGRIKDTIPFTGKKDENAKAGPNQAVADKDAPATATAPRGTSVALAETASAPGGVAVPEDPDVEKAKPAPKFNPYDHIQAAPGEGIMVPPDAPRAQKKGLLRTLFGVGGGSTESEHDVAQDDPKYRDISNR